MKNKSTIVIVAIVLGVLITLIPHVIFPVCTNRIELVNGKTLFMNCHWTAMAELPVGILILFDGILFLVFKKTETHIALSIMLILFGLIALMLPTAIIGMCNTITMPCRTGTEPALIVGGVTAMLVGIGNVFYNLNHLKQERLTKERSVFK